MEYLVTLKSFRGGLFYKPVKTALEVTLIGSLITHGCLPWSDWSVEIL